MKKTLIYIIYILLGCMSLLALNENFDTFYLNIVGVLSFLALIFLNEILEYLKSNQHNCA